MVWFAAAGFFAWACFSISNAPPPKIKSLGHLTFFESVVIGVFYAAILFVKTWKGIVGVVLGLIAWGIKEAGSKCSKCDKRLLDVNSPMGWKLFRELYGNRQTTRLHR